MNDGDGLKILNLDNTNYAKMVDGKQFGPDDEKTEIWLIKLSHLFELVYIYVCTVPQFKDRFAANNIFHCCEALIFTHPLVWSFLST